MNGARAIMVQHDVWIHGSEAKNFTKHVSWYTLFICHSLLLKEPQGHYSTFHILKDNIDG